MQVPTSIVLRLLTDIQVDKKVEERSDSSEEESEDDSKSVSSVGGLAITMDFSNVRS